MKSILKYFYVFLFFAINKQSNSQGLPQETNPAFIQTMATVNKVANSNNYVGALTIDSSASLPIGIYKQIGQATYIIAVDSARFMPTGASCSAYMAIALPGMADSIAFAAKNIGINPKGVLSGNVGSSRLLLVSHHRIKLSPKITMVLKNDGHNYVEWNCNGF